MKRNPGNKTVIIVALMLFTSAHLYSQGFMSLEHGLNVKFESVLKNDDVLHCFSVRPLNHLNSIDQDSLISVYHNITSYKDQNWIARKIKNEHFAQIKEKKFSLRIDPAYNLKYTYNRINGNDYVVNTRAAVLSGAISDKLSFTSMFYENQATFPEYLNTYITKRNIVPGRGAWKKFKENGKDYAWITGYFIWKPIKNISFSMGHGKFFFGNGYRSLMLSDNSFNYPFINIAYNGDHFKYGKLLSSFINDVRDIGARVLPGKYASFQYLSYIPVKQFQVMLFEGNIWEESPHGNGKFDQAMLNPIIFTNILSAQNHSILGIDLRIDPSGKWTTYGQLVMDNFNFTSYSSRDIKGFHQYGYQLGFKHFDAFNIKNLFIQAETNTVQPYTYNFRESGQSYTHYNQPLAHPSGANFSEQTGILRYNYSRVHFEVKTNYIIQGTDSTQNVHYGKDLFKSYQTATTPYPEAELYQGAKHNILHLDANISWIFNPLSGMQFTLGWVYRKENTGEASSHSNQFIYAALRTNLHNFYDDF